MLICEGEDLCAPNSGRNRKLRICTFNHKPEAESSKEKKGEIMNSQNLAQWHISFITAPLGQCHQLETKHSHIQPMGDISHSNDHTLVSSFVDTTANRPLSFYCQDCAYQIDKHFRRLLTLGITSTNTSKNSAKGEIFMDLKHDC